MPSHPFCQFLLQPAPEAVIPQADYLIISTPSTLSHHEALRLSFPQHANKSQDGMLAQVESSFKMSWDQGCAARKPFFGACARIWNHQLSPSPQLPAGDPNTKSRWDFAYGTC